MNQAKIRLLCVYDPLVKEWAELAYQKVKEDYEVGSGGKISLEATWVYQDLSTIPFEDYYGNNYGVNRGWITEDTKKKFGIYNDTIDCIAYFIPDSYWSKEGNINIFGWNGGIFFNGYQVEQIRTIASKRSNHLTLSMELLHALDNVIDKTKGLKYTNKLFGVEDFDENIVHDDEKWYKGYRTEIGIIADTLIEVLSPREKRLAIIEILKKLVELYRLLIIQRQKGPSPVYYHTPPIMDNKNNMKNTERQEKLKVALGVIAKDTMLNYPEVSKLTLYINEEDIVYSRDGHKEITDEEANDTIELSKSPVRTGTGNLKTEKYQ